jgi:hypothetical protein
MRYINAMKMQCILIPKLIQNIVPNVENNTERGVKE